MLHFSRGACTPENAANRRATLLSFAALLPLTIAAARKELYVERSERSGPNGPGGHSDDLNGDKRAQLRLIFAALWLVFLGWVGVSVALAQAPAGLPGQAQAPQAQNNKGGHQGPLQGTPTPTRTRTPIATASCGALTLINE